MEKEAENLPEVSPLLLEPEAVQNPEPRGVLKQKQIVTYPILE